MMQRSAHDYIFTESNVTMQYLDLSSRTDNVIVCGDIHGEYETLVHEIKRHGISDAVVIVAGDCGFGFCRPSYYDDIYKQKMHGKLEKSNVLLLMVRGNHDDPIYFEKELIDYPYMKTLPDYTVVHTTSHNILCIGGAVSQDRNFRKSMMEVRGKGKMPMWWANEPFVLKEEELQVLEDEYVHIDTVITHPAPSFCPPLVKGDFECFCANDDTLADDVRRERESLDAVYDWLKQHDHPLRNWYYGHYHHSDICERDGTLFHLLSINELKEIGV